MIVFWSKSEHSQPYTIAQGTALKRWCWRDGAEGMKQQIMRKKLSVVKGLWAIVLAIMLTGCGVLGGGPNHQLVERAIALELDQAQQVLSQQLRLNAQPNKLWINRVKVNEQTPLVIQGLQAYRVRGIYDYTIKLPTQQVTQRDNAFEVYLQRQKEGKTWKLARLQANEDGEPAWVTQRIYLKGDRT